MSLHIFQVIPTWLEVLILIKYIELKLSETSFRDEGSTDGVVDVLIQETGHVKLGCARNSQSLNFRSPSIGRDLLNISLLSKVVNEKSQEKFRIVEYPRQLAPIVTLTHDNYI